MNSCVSTEDGAHSWIIHSFILEALVHGVIQRNKTRVQINSKLTILYIIFVTEFKINPLNVLLERTISNDY